MKNAIADQFFGTILAGYQSERIIGTALMAGMDENWFTDREYSRLWKVIVDLYQQDKDIFLQAVMIRADLLGLAIHADRLEKIVDQASVMADWTESIEQIKSAYLLRQAEGVLTLCGAMIKDANEETARDAIAKVQSLVMGIDAQEQNNDIHPADDAIEQVEKWRTTDIVDRDGMHWFLPSIDKVIGPLTDELVYLNALPSVGKTAFALNMVCRSAYRSERVSFVSLESPRSKIAQRITSIVSQHNANALKFKRALDSKYDEAVKSLKAFKEYPSGWTFNARTVEQIYAWARTEKKSGSRAIVIDNMKHIKTHAADSTVEQFRELSLKLKELRDMLGMAVVVLHHLNDDLKASWSRDIERDADIIVNLINADDDLSAEVRKIRFICAKNRDGNTGEIPILFHKQTQTFTEVL